MTPDRYCENSAAPAGSDLYYATLYVPDDARRAVLALHAFRAELDAAARRRDDQVARARFEWWRGELDRCFAGKPQHPVTLALQTPVARYGLAREYFDEILDGVETDLERRRFASMSELTLYCHRVSGVVASLAAEVCGYTDRATPKCAIALGTAFRLTELLGNLGDDLRRGRLYLPADELDAAGIAPDSLRVDAVHERLTPLVRRLADTAQRGLDAAAALPHADRAAQRMLLTRAAIARKLLRELERDGYRPAPHRIDLTPLRKLWLAWITARRTRVGARR